MKFWSVMFLFYIGVTISTSVAEYGNTIFLAGYLLGLAVGYLVCKESATVRQGGGQTVYEWREIGETEWRVCDEEWFKFCQNSPLYDTRAKQGGAGC